MNSSRMYRWISGIVMAVAVMAAWTAPAARAQTERAAAAAPASPAPGGEEAASPSAKPHDGSFIIGNDDRLSINVWKEPELTQTVPVRSDGKISLPLIGEVEASGRTPLQLENDIAGKLRAFITEPDVTVMVTQINSEKFNILGRVIRPGSYSLTATTTVLDAIAMAGGFQDFARQKSVYILRQNPGGGETRIPFNYKEMIKGKNPEQNIKLEPHDTVIVP